MRSRRASRSTPTIQTAQQRKTRRRRMEEEEELHGTTTQMMTMTFPFVSTDTTMKSHQAPMKFALKAMTAKVKVAPMIMHSEQSKFFGADDSKKFSQAIFKSAILSSSRPAGHRLRHAEYSHAVRNITKAGQFLTGLPLTTLPSLSQ